MPEALPRSLDHVVHAVHDLDAAAAFYARLGFTVGARNRHAAEWGTQNHIVQLPGFFVELLALADTRAIAPHRRDFFSFGAFNRDFLARSEELSMLVLEGRDSAAERAMFRAAGIGDFEPFAFEREAGGRTARRPKSASLVFAHDAKAPDIGYFAWRLSHPENFWNPAFQEHPNSAAGIAGAVLVADRPEDHREFLCAFTGVRTATTDSSGVALQTPRGDIAVMVPAEFDKRYGIAPPEAKRGSRLAALRFAVRDIATARAALKAGKIDFTERPQHLVVGPDTAFGATLTFEELRAPAL